MSKIAKARKIIEISTMVVLVAALIAHLYDGASVSESPVSRPPPGESPVGLQIMGVGFGKFTQHGRTHTHTCNRTVYVQLSHAHSVRA